MEDQTDAGRSLMKMRKRRGDQVYYLVGCQRQQEDGLTLIGQLRHIVVDQSDKPSSKAKDYQ